MARIGRPQEQVLALSDIERDELERLGRSQSASHSLVRRALERRQPMLPLGLGYIEGVTHDYVRHGRF